MPAPPKLSEADVREIRRRVKGGEQVSALAKEFGVNRKTVRRRLNALELADQEKAYRVAAARLKRHVSEQRSKLKRREEPRGNSGGETAGSETPRGRRSSKSDYEAWLDRPKNLGGRARAEASGLVYMQTPDRKNRRWGEQAEVFAMFEKGWILVD